MTSERIRSPSDFLDEQARLAKARLAAVSKALPGRLAAAVDPSRWVRESPLSMLAGAFALSALVSNHLSRRDPIDSLSSDDLDALRRAQHAATERRESPLANALFAPILSLASRHLLSRISDLAMEGTEPSPSADAMAPFDVPGDPFPPIPPN